MSIAAGGGGQMLSFGALLFGERASRRNLQPTLGAEKPEPNPG
jgi:hypothetical protein